MIRLKKIRDSARGQECTVAIYGVCNSDTETTVFAHYGEPGEKGIGLKPDDTSGAYACSKCHDVLDGRVTSTACYGDVQKTWYWFRACRRTWKLLVENGVLK